MSKSKVGAWPAPPASTRHRRDPDWLRDQLLELAVEIEFWDVPPTIAQLQRLLRCIAGGEEWEMGSWR